MKYRVIREGELYHNDITSKSWAIVKEDELYHYGVKGMKWGVRKAINSVKKRFKKSELKEKTELKKKSELEGEDETIDVGKYKGVYLSRNDVTQQEARKMIKEKFNDNRIKESIAKEMYDDPRMFEEWLKDDDGKVLFSRNEFKNKMRLDYINAADIGFVAGYYDGGTYGGHIFEAECDGKTGKVKRISMWG